MDTAPHRLQTLFDRCDKSHSPWKKKQNHKNKGGVYPSMNEWINNRNNATTVRKLIFCRQLKNFLFFYNCRTFYILWIFCLHLRKPIVVHSATDETKPGSNQFTNIKQFVCIWIMRIPWMFFLQRFQKKNFINSVLIIRVPWCMHYFATGRNV